eukprot:m.295341 g.295341  ORF g.295341 m.295341 type:complete len:228 (-) comp57322_c0_seq1:23-706(-)
MRSSDSLLLILQPSMGSSASKKAAKATKATVRSLEKDKTPAVGENDILNVPQDQGSTAAAAISSRVSSANSAGSNRSLLERTFTKEDFANTLPPVLPSQQTYAILSVPKLSNSADDDNLTSQEYNQTSAQLTVSSQDTSYASLTEQALALDSTPPMLSATADNAILATQPDHTRPSSHSPLASRADSFSSLQLDLDVGGALAEEGDEPLSVEGQCEHDAEEDDMSRL